MTPSLVMAIRSFVGQRNQRRDGRFAAGTATGNASVGNNSFSGVSRVLGSNFDDLLIGNGGDNDLNGGTGGNDTLEGGGGNDTLTGGSGDDVFRYTGNSTAELAAQGGDLIGDFVDAGGDLIDVSSFAATAGNGLWLFNGTGAFSGGGQASITYSVAADTLVEFDHNGDGAADASITLTGAHALTANEFDLVV